MKNQILSSYKPGLVGCFISFLLIISFFLKFLFGTDPVGLFGFFPEVVAINTILQLIVLCCCVHLVRRTSEIYYKHVWYSSHFVILWMIPVFNLVVMACQFVWNNSPVWNSPVFLSVLVLFSMPAFCCYFFTSICLFFKRQKIFVILTAILDVLCFLYYPLSLMFRIFYNNTTKCLMVDFPFVLEVLILNSRWFSFMIYVISFVNFILLARLFNSDRKSNRKI